MTCADGDASFQQNKENNAFVTVVMFFHFHHEQFMESR